MPGGITIIESEDNVVDSNYIHSCPAGINIYFSRRIEINDNFLVDNDRNIMMMNRQKHDSSYIQIIISGNTIGR